MSNGDYGYFGKGDTGYAQYMTAFNRNFGGSSGGGGGGGNHNNNGGGGGDGSGCGCLIAIAVVVVLAPQLGGVHAVRDFCRALRVCGSGRRAHPAGDAALGKHQAVYSAV